MKNLELHNVIDGDECITHSIGLEGEYLLKLIEEQTTCLQYVPQRSASIDRTWNIGLESEDEGVQAKKSVATRVMEFIRKIVKRIVEYIKNIGLAIIGKAHSDDKVKGLEENVAFWQGMSNKWEGFSEDLVKEKSTLRDDLFKMTQTAAAAQKAHREAAAEIEKLVSAARTSGAYYKNNKAIDEASIKKLLNEKGDLQAKISALNLENGELEKKLLSEIDKYRNEIFAIGNKLVAQIETRFRENYKEAGEKVGKTLFAKQAGFKDMLFILKHDNEFFDYYADAEAHLNNDRVRLLKYIAASDTAVNNLLTDPHRTKEDKLMEFRNLYSSFKVTEADLADLATGGDTRTSLVRFNSKITNSDRVFRNFKQIQKDFDEVEKTCGEIERDLKSETDPAKVEHLAKVVTTVRSFLVSRVVPNIAHLANCMSIYQRAKKQYADIMPYISGVYQQVCKEIIETSITESYKATGIELDEPSKAQVTAIFWNVIRDNGAQLKVFPTTSRTK